MVGWHHWLDGHEFEQALGDGMVIGREAWQAAVHGVTKSWTRLSDWTELRMTMVEKTDLHMALSAWAPLCQPYTSYCHWWTSVLPAVQISVPPLWTIFLWNQPGNHTLEKAMLHPAWACIPDRALAFSFLAVAPSQHQHGFIEWLNLSS